MIRYFYRSSEEYNEYYNSIKKFLPKKLVGYYDEKYSGNEHNRFHDCVLSSLEFNCDSYKYKNVSDSIKLKLRLGEEIEYKLEINKIKSLNIKFNKSKEEIEINDYNCFLGEIINFELGLTDDKFYLIKFHTSVEFEFYVEFKQIKIKKLKLK